jgi:hypothetical protein
VSSSQKPYLNMYFAKVRGSFSAPSDRMWGNRENVSRYVLSQCDATKSDVGRVRTGGRCPKNSIIASSCARMEDDVYAGGGIGGGIDGNSTSVAVEATPVDARKRTSGRSTTSVDEREGRVRERAIGFQVGEGKRLGGEYR